MGPPMSNSPHHLEQALDLLAERLAEKLRKPAEPLEALRRRQKGPNYIKVGRLVRYLRRGLGAPITPR